MSFDPTRTAQAGLSWPAANSPPGNPDGSSPHQAPPQGGACAPNRPAGQPFTLSLPPKPLARGTCSPLRLPRRNSGGGAYFLACLYCALRDDRLLQSGLPSPRPAVGVIRAVRPEALARPPSGRPGCPPGEAMTSPGALARNTDGPAPRGRRRVPAPGRSTTTWPSTAASWARPADVAAGVAQASPGGSLAAGGHPAATSTGPEGRPDSGFHGRGATRPRLDVAAEWPPRPPERVSPRRGAPGRPGVQRGGPGLLAFRWPSPPPRPRQSRRC